MASYASVKGIWVPATDWKHGPQGFISHYWKPKPYGYKIYTKMKTSVFRGAMDWEPKPLLFVNQNLVGPNHDWEPKPHESKQWFGKQKA